MCVFPEFSGGATISHRALASENVLKLPQPESNEFGRGLRRMVHSERFERPTLGIEIRCSIQLSYECDTIPILCWLEFSRPIGIKGRSYQNGAGSSAPYEALPIARVPIASGARAVQLSRGSG